MLVNVKLTLTTAHRLMMLRSLLHRLHVPVLRMSVWLMRVMVKVHILLLLHGKIPSLIAAHFHIACEMHVLPALHLNIPAAPSRLDVHHLRLFHMNVHRILTLIEGAPLLLLLLMILHELSILVLLILLIYFDILVRMHYHLVVRSHLVHRSHLRLLLLHYNFLLDHLWGEWHLNLTFVELTRVVVKLLLGLLLVWHPLSHVGLLRHLLHHWLTDRSHVTHRHRVFDLVLLGHVFKCLRGR